MNSLKLTKVVKNFNLTVKLLLGYCNNNFNDLLHSLVLEIELTVVNQWHIITLGYTLVTSEWARVFFVIFHMIVVLLIMKLVNYVHENADFGSFKEIIACIFLT